MDKIMNKILKTSIITSIIFLIFGLLLILESEATIISLSYIIGTVLIALGAYGIVNFFRKNKIGISTSLDVVYGIVTIILGILVITNPRAIASIIPFVMGIIIIISSASKIQYSLELKNIKSDMWKTTLAISILTTICGVMLIFNPFKGAVIVTKIIGILISVYSTLDITSSIVIKKHNISIYEEIETKIIEADVVEDKQEEKKEETSKKKKSTKKKITKRKKEEEN